MIRQPIITVMGHVDHGKTATLDRIRSTTVASREAGGITQHIGASEVSIGSINAICGPLLNALGIKITIPGLLFIDTPGHEAFTNLRVRGGSVADIAIVVVDISKGFEPQTLEAIEILKEYRTPFVLAANKIDLITGWRASGSNSLAKALELQTQEVANELDSRVYQTVGKLSELGFGSELYSRIRDFQREIAIVPMSAKTGEGIAELLMVVTGLAQRYLESKLKIEISGPGKGSILEKKEIKGLGVTVDVILYDGTLHVNDTVAFATQNGVGTAKVKALLKPKARGKGTEGLEYMESVSAASGVKISGTGLDEALPGSPIVQAVGDDYSSSITAEMGDIFSTDRNGIILKTDTIGSMDAISKLLKKENFGVSKKGIGTITKRDVLDAFAMKASDQLGSVVMGFNVGMEEDAKAASESSGVTIITGEIIYRLIDDYKLFVEQQQRSSAKAAEDRVVFPAAIEVLPNSCFRASHPAIFGISVIAGRIKPGYRLIGDDGTPIGKIRGIQNEKTPIEMAKKGDMVAISVDGPTFGRQVRDGQTLYTDMRDGDFKLLSEEFSSMIGDDERNVLEKIRKLHRVPI